MSSNNSNKYYVTTCHVHERARWEKTTKHLMNEYKNNYMMMWDGKCKVSSVMLYYKLRDYQIKKSSLEEL